MKKKHTASTSEKEVGLNKNELRKARGSTTSLQSEELHMQASAQGCHPKNDKKRTNTHAENITLREKILEICAVKIDRAYEYANGNGWDLAVAADYYGELEKILRELADIDDRGCDLTVVAFPSRAHPSMRTRGPKIERLRSLLGIINDRF